MLSIDISGGKNLCVAVRVCALLYRNSNEKSGLLRNEATHLSTAMYKYLYHVCVAGHL